MGIMLFRLVAGASAAGRVMAMALTGTVVFPVFSMLTVKLA